MQRVIAYIDGFNLYFGLRDRGLKPYYWLDLVGLIRSLLKPDQQLEAVHYFTARIRATPGNRADKRFVEEWPESQLNRQVGCWLVGSRYIMATGYLSNEEIPKLD